MSRYPTRRPTGTPLDMLALAQRVAASSTIVPTDDAEIVDAEPVLDARGRHRSPANRPGAHRGGGQMTRGFKARGVAEARVALGTDWMTLAECAQAVPPAFTAHIGEYLMLEINARRKVAA